MWSNVGKGWKSVMTASLGCIARCNDCWWKILCKKILQFSLLVQTSFCGEEEFGSNTTEWCLKFQITNSTSLIINTPLRPNLDQSVTDIFKFLFQFIFRHSFVSIFKQIYLDICWYRFFIRIYSDICIKIILCQNVTNIWIFVQLLIQTLICIIFLLFIFIRVYWNIHSYLNQYAYHTLIWIQMCFEWMICAERGVMMQLQHCASSCNFSVPSEYFLPWSLLLIHFHFHPHFHFLIYFHF